MGRVVERLEFMVKMNQRLKTETFDALFSEPEFASQFADFISSPQAKKWLTKAEGKLYTYWNSS